MTCVDNTVFCMVCNKQTKYTLDHFSRYHLKKEHNISIKEYYDQYMRKTGEGICPVCGKETTLINMVKGYSRCCSYECMRNDEQYHNKRNEGISKINFEEAQKKRECTNIDRYGTSHVSQLEYVKDKIKETCIEKYGKPSLQLEHVKEKRNESLHTNECNLKRIEGICKTVDVAAERRKETILKKYGVEYITQIEGVADKVLKTKHLKYGFRTIEELSEFEKYKRLVWIHTRKIVNMDIKNNNEVCYYSGLVLNTKKYHPLSKTIDHKISIIYGFRNNIPAEVIGAKDNLCLAARKVNLIKNYRTEEEFRSSMDFIKVIHELRQL